MTAVAANQQENVLSDLVYEAVPHWTSRLERYIAAWEEKERENQGLIARAMTTECGAMKTQKADSMNAITTQNHTAILPSVVSPSTPAPDDGSDKLVVKEQSRLLTGTHSMCRLEVKSNTSKPKFSSLTGPVVYYDGESQQMLIDLWTALTNKRKGLRTEMMNLQRRQQAMAPPTPRLLSDFNIDSEDENGDEKKPLPYRRARMSGIGPMGSSHASGANAEDEKFKTLLMQTDENLDKACKGAETVAFVWLKGDPYDLHLRFIVACLKDAVQKIIASGILPPKKPEEGGRGETQTSSQTMH